jgi:Bifunctional DNA primase/polymerase, N-terminal
VEETTEAPAGAPQHLTAQLLDAAVRYAEERHWDVLPGAWLENDGTGTRCSCRDLGCPSPGAHPTRSDWPGQATGGGATVRRMWQDEPRASILLPTGRTFDVIAVPEMAGCLALARMERMEVRLGPVICVPGRWLIFFVLPGVAAKIPEQLRRLGWGPSALDLVARGEGDYIPAPPTRLPSGGCVVWARQPTAMNRWLPDAAELLNPIAYACGRRPR